MTAGLTSVLLCAGMALVCGRAIVAQGTPDVLKRKVAGDSVILSFEQQRSTVVVAELVSRLEGATDPSIEGNEVRFQVPDGATALPVLLRAMVEHDLDATGVEVHRPTLDDVFLTMTGRSLRDEAMAGTTDKAAA